MTQIQFLYNNNFLTSIQCKEDEKFNDILKNYLFNEIKINLDSVTYLYEKKEIKNLESCLSELTKNKDKENNIIIIEIFDPIIIDSHEYKIVEEIGEGGSSKVYKVLNNEDNKFYAIKVKNNQVKESFSIFQNEVQNISKFNNKNIVRYYSSKNDGKKFYILMEYCDGLNLEQFLEKHKTKNNENNENKENKENKVKLIEEDILYNIIKQICSGIKEIHDKNIIHRDLKPSNIFINKDNEIKVGDFGISKQLDNVKTTTYTKKGAGTLFYSAPEILKKSKYNKKADMYSLGCIIYELFTLSEYHSDKMGDEIKPLDQKYDPNWQKLINSLLDVDIVKRFDINEVNDYILKNIKISSINENQMKNNDNENDKNNEIRIYVKTSTGRTKEFNIDSYYRINYINRWYLCNEGYKAMSLIYKGTVLDHKKKFQDYGIKNGDTIFLYPPIRGCSYGGKHIKINMKYKEQIIDISVCPDCAKVRDLKESFLSKIKYTSYYGYNSQYKGVCELSYNGRILDDEDIKIKSLGIGENSEVNITIYEELFEYTKKYSKELYELYEMGFDDEEIDIMLFKNCSGSIPNYLRHIFG